MQEFEDGLAVLAGRTRVVTFVIFAFLVASLLTALAAAGEWSGHVDMEAAELDPASIAAIFAYLAYTLIFIASVIIVGMWINRAHKNLRAAGIDGLEFTPGWAVGWFFVPIANLFKPFQAMRALWNVSHNQGDGFTDKSDPQLTLWWATWIIGNMLANISFRLSSLGSEGKSVAAILDLVSTVLLAVAAWALLKIVRKINVAQRSMVGLAQTFA